MQVTILGAGTAVPARGRSPAGIAVRIGSDLVLLDAGPGTLQRLAASGAPWTRLDRIFLTHFHLDHCLDLASILFALRIPDVGRRAALWVYGPPGLRTLYKRLNQALYCWLTPRGFRLRLVEVGHGTTLRLPGYTVRTARMAHDRGRALAYRLTAGSRRLVYSGDTGECPALVRLARGADTLILECSMPDERPVDGHLTPGACGRIAAAAGAGHLILTHFYPVFHGYDIRGRVREAFRGRVTLARDGARFVLGPA